MSNERIERAGTVELDAAVNGKQMFAYMVPGCCGARSYYGFDGKNGVVPTPAEVIEGIVRSGISGNIMFLTDVYNKGKQAEAFKAFVEENKLGTVTIAPPVRNRYTGSQIWGVIFCYDPQGLTEFVDKTLKATGDGWRTPETWYSTYDAVHMDAVFYQYGGRPKPKKDVLLNKNSDALMSAAAAK